MFSSTSGPEQLSQGSKPEAYCTINELAKILRMSFERVRCMVKNEPGVLCFRPESPAKARTRTMYRIPESVAQRILRRSANRAG